ncbi:MAG: hypothetical protein ABUT20_21295 [Bacteroidota bacterium]
MKNSKNLYAFLALLIFILINSCTPTSVPFKGKYEESTIEIISTKTTDSAWLIIAELFDQEGLKIKTVDRKKGMITTAKSVFTSVYTFEDSNGVLINPQAWVVLQKDSVNKKEWMPKQIYGRWHIQIASDGNGFSSIKIDPIIICTYYPNDVTSVETRGQSTGKLEYLIKKSLSDSSN